MIDLADLRQPRIGPFTLFDTAAAYLGMLILSPLLTWLFSRINLQITLKSWLWLTLPLSVIFHIVFQQSTPLMKMLSNPYLFEFYIALAVLLFMTYMGLKDIKKKHATSTTD